MTVSRRATFPAVIARFAGRPSIPETPVMKSRGRSVDTPLEPVIGLAEGETRWRVRRPFGRSSGARKQLHRTLLLPLRCLVEPSQTYSCDRIRHSLRLQASTAEAT